MATEEASAVIPGRREAAGPESRYIGISCVSGFRARAFGAPRNDGEFKGYFPSANAIKPIDPTTTRHQANSEKPWRCT